MMQEHAYAHVGPRQNILCMRRVQVYAFAFIYRCGLHIHFLFAQASRRGDVEGSPQSIVRALHSCPNSDPRGITASLMAAFPCTFCDKKFTQRYNMLRHVSAAHGDAAGENHATAREDAKWRKDHDKLPPALTAEEAETVRPGSDNTRFICLSCDKELLKVSAAKHFVRCFKGDVSICRTWVTTLDGRVLQYGWKRTHLENYFDVGGDGGEDGDLQAEGEADAELAEDQDEDADEGPSIRALGARPKQLARPADGPMAELHQAEEDDALSDGGGVPDALADGDVPMDRLESLVARVGELTRAVERVQSGVGRA
jgi:uncharacterized C2H2 Zn-finger protein